MQTPVPCPQPECSTPPPAGLAAPPMHRIDGSQVDETLDAEDRAKNRTAEQQRWAAAVEDCSFVGLALRVLERCAPDAGAPLLLRFDARERAFLAEHFGSVASRRLRTRPIDLQAYVRLIGDPVESIRSAFESEGADAVAAVSFALTHDQMASRDALGHLAPVRAALRFGFARCLARSQPKARSRCHDLVTDLAASSDIDPSLHAELTAWLETPTAET